MGRSWFLSLSIFTRGQFWPSGIVIACVCGSVCVCVYQSRVCPHDNSSPIQARITKFGPEMQNTLVWAPLVFGDDRPWSSRSNLTCFIYLLPSLGILFLHKLNELGKRCRHILINFDALLVMVSRLILVMLALNIISSYNHNGICVWYLCMSLQCIHCWYAGVTMVLCLAISFIHWCIWLYTVHQLHFNVLYSISSASANILLACSSSAWMFIHTEMLSNSQIVPWHLLI